MGLMEMLTPLLWVLPEGPALGLVLLSRGLQASDVMTAS